MRATPSARRRRVRRKRRSSLLGALAHARAGAPRGARAARRGARPRPVRPTASPTSLSLRGRLSKDEYHRAREAAGSEQVAERARQEYLAAYALAARSLSRHQRRHAVAAAGRACERGPWRGDCYTTNRAAPTRTCWDLATLGEAQLLLGQSIDAAQSYAAAYARIPGDAGIVATMRRQLRLLARVIPEAAACSSTAGARRGGICRSYGRCAGSEHAAFPAALAPQVRCGDARLSCRCTGRSSTRRPPAAPT